MRISDWSSDVCSSDLEALQAVRAASGDGSKSGGGIPRMTALSRPAPANHRLVLTILHLTLSSHLPTVPRRQVDRVGLKQGEGRSEEHTSELQSLMRTSYAVFCLKKKKKQ